MNERYPDSSLSYLYDSASNREETRLGLSVPIPTPDVDDLLGQVTKKNLHPATEWGQDVGREVIPA